MKIEVLDSETCLNDIGLIPTQHPQTFIDPESGAVAIIEDQTAYKFSFDNGNYQPPETVDA